MFYLLDKVLSDYLQNDITKTIYTTKWWQYVSDDFIQLCNKFNIKHILVTSKADERYNETKAVSIKQIKEFEKWSSKYSFELRQNHPEISKIKDFYDDPVAMTKMIQLIVFEWNNNKKQKSLNEAPIAFRESQGYRRKKLEVLLNVRKVI